MHEILHNDLGVFICLLFRSQPNVKERDLGVCTLILELGRLSQKKSLEFKASLVYLRNARPTGMTP